MAFEKLKYGVEYDPSSDWRGESGTGWRIVVAVLALVALAGAVAAVRRVAPAVRRAFAAARERPAATEPAIAAVPRPARAPGPAARTAPAASALNEDDLKRPAKVRNLLLRLQAAERDGNLEMQISTMQQLRELPGEAAADMVAKQAPRLGALNLQWLFERKNPKWVARVSVRPGDTATRIAAEHGCTLAAMERLNGWKSAPPLRAGTAVYVMERPRFSIVAHRRSGEIDLFLGGAFFKNYAVRGDPAPSKVKYPPGEYASGRAAGGFFASAGFDLPKKDIAELDMLVPQNSPVNLD